MPRDTSPVQLLVAGRDETVVFGFFPVTAIRWTECDGACAEDSGAAIRWNGGVARGGTATAKQDCEG